ncbi:MAG: endonuclease III [Muribaculaceae bacterium]|nr:endonuclease III [Muribaculaceae bacterium]
MAVKRPTSQKEICNRVVDWFEHNMQEAKTELHYNNEYELLVAVILSAQCTDKRVNMITPPLFEAYPTVEAMAKASADDIFGYIRSVSYPNNKARNLALAARMIVNEYEGKVPETMDELLKIPGVGRKTANVMLSVAFGQQAIAVDTHVFRVSERLGITRDSKSPLETERTLCRYLPADKLSIAHHWLILHGRYVCTARRPKCLECGLKDVCRYYNREKKE